MKKILIDSKNFSDDKLVNIIIDSKEFGLTNGFIVQIPHGHVMSTLANAKKERPYARLLFINKLKALIVSANKYFDDPAHKSQIGNSVRWTNLMSDCGLLAIYNSVHFNEPLEILTDEAMAYELSVQKDVDPALKSVK